MQIIQVNSSLFNLQNNFSFKSTSDNMVKESNKQIIITTEHTNTETADVLNLGFVTFLF